MSRALVALFAALALAVPAPAGSAPATDELERQKLEQEIRKLRNDNERAESLLGDLLAWAPFITVLVAVAAVVVPVIRELRQQRLQRESETNQKLDEQFAKAVGDLGAAEKAVQVSGVVALENFLRPEFSTYHEQIYRILCANLTVGHDDLVNRFIVRAFSKAARIHVEAAAARGEREELDLARCNAPRVDLSGLDLTGADVAFADLSGANLTGATLFRAKGIDVILRKARLSRANLGEARFHKAIAEEAEFHGADLKAAKFREADLRKAEFQQAKLQGAHFDGAQLAGASFDQANLAEAFFYGVTDFDQSALRSILNSVDRSWVKAKFDPDVEAELEAMAARRPPAKKKSTGSTPEASGPSVP